MPRALIRVAVKFCAFSVLTKDEHVSTPSSFALFCFRSEDFSSFQVGEGVASACIACISASFQGSPCTSGHTVIIPMGGKGRAQEGAAPGLSQTNTLSISRVSAPEGQD